MNILAVCHYGLYQDLTSSFVHNQLRHIAALGHRVRVIIPNGIGKTGRDGKKAGKLLRRTEADGVELYDLRYITLSSYGKKFFNAASAIAAIRLHKKQLLEDFQPDVIHAHTLGFDSEIGAWLKKLTGCPLVVTTHGSDTAVPMANGGGEMLRRTADKADRLVAVSRQLGQLLESCGTVTPVLTVHNGFVPHPVPENCQKDPFAMIQVGHLIPSKRTEVTIRAFAALKKQYPGLTLTVIGTGHLRSALEQLCRELGVADAVRFTGQLPNRQVFAEMCRASYFVMASKPEGFGIVYLEAMAAGCVTVGTLGQGIADVIENGKNGFLVEADDIQAVVSTLDRCLKDPEMGAAVARAGRQTAAGLDWDTNAHRYEALFEQLRTQRRAET